MPNWTMEQQKAIETRGGKVIVSAAAGSGKTAVLSQRVINFILNGGNVTDLLIVTFTKAAAEEMKQRIKDNIKKEYAKSKSEHLKKQISLVDCADIYTMDAFYGNLVKSNFEKLNIDRNFLVLSNEEEKLLKEKVISNVLETCFEKIENYKDILYMFGASNNDLIKDTVLKISDYLDTLPDKQTFINKALDNYKNDFYKRLIFENIFSKVNSFKKLYEDIVEDLKIDPFLYNKSISLANIEINYMNKIINSNDFNTLSQNLKLISFDRFSTPKGHACDEEIIKYKSVREDFKTFINKTLEEYKYINEDIYNEEQKLCGDMLESLFEIVLLYEKELLKEKRKINSYTFNDIAHFCVELLIKDDNKTHLAKEISKRYEEILIDEYQDTNNLQNIIFNSISKDNSNLFIVGDVKQSIYRFRSACPHIFNKDKANASKDGFPRLITLSKNFRSRKEVLDFCNFIFENTMSNDFGEVDYNGDEFLYLGASFEDGKDLETEVCIINDDACRPEEVYVDTLDDLEEEEDLTSYQKEAILVAEKIKKLIKDKRQVYDNKNNLWRDIKASDISILLRSMKHSSLYIKALNKRGISVYSLSSSLYFDNYEIKLLINLLKIINNPYDDVALLSVINSDLLNIDLDLVANLRRENKYVSLYDSLIKSDDKEIISLFNDLKSLKDYSLNNSVSSLISVVLNKFNMIPVLSAYKNGVEVHKNLTHMISHAINFESNTSSSLSEFINYIENIIKNKGSLEGINPLKEGDNVLITTIHKSKGLEYPVVILSETGSKFNFKDLNSDLMINDDLGIAFTIRNIDNFSKKSSFPLLLFKDMEKRKMLSEELRILYVALTRAKEKLIITGYTKNLSNKLSNVVAKMGNLKNISGIYLSGVNNYLEILLPCLLRNKSCAELRDMCPLLPKIFKSDSVIDTKIVDSSSINEKEFEEEEKKIKETFDVTLYNKLSSFNYESNFIGVPLYKSVSDIKSHDKIYKVKPDFMKDGLNHTNIGTLYHKIFEMLPIKKYTIDTLEGELLRLVNNGSISLEERKLIKLDNIFAYLTSDIYDLLLTSDIIYKEKRLSFLAPASLYDESLDNSQILVEGIIDLLFIKDDTYYIVDYKTDDVDKLNDLVERYKVQLNLYEIGVKQIFGAKEIKKFIYSIKLNKFIEI